MIALQARGRAARRLLRSVARRALRSVARSPSARVTRSCACFALVCAAACTAPPRTAVEVPSAVAAEWEEVLGAEDARIATDSDLAVIRGALESDHPFLRAMAVRAIGRSERHDLMSMIAPLLRDDSDSVRAAAAHALADVSRESDSAEARRLLLDALREAAGNGADAAAIVESLGRLRADSVSAHALAQTLTEFLARDNPARTGALRGLYFLARQPSGRAATAEVAAQRLQSVIVDPADSASDRLTLPSETSGARERGLALAALALARAADERTLIRALRDTEPQVRREAVAAAATLRDTAAVRRIAVMAGRDDNAAVRLEALRLYAARLAQTRGCAPVIAAVRDTNVHVSLLAIDLLGTTCRSADAGRTLTAISATLPADPEAWHRAAHAMVSLAARASQRARPGVHAMAQRTSAFERTYAARAAAAIPDTALLYRLAHDEDANVRTAAITGLATVVGHSADSVFAAQLASSESELLITAAAALEGSRHPGIAHRLLEALDRVTALRRETSRDARIALLARLQELGSSELSERLTPYLHDFDAAVAIRAADVLHAWTGTRPVPSPAPLPRQPLPTFDTAVDLAEKVFVLEMENGATIELRLLPFDAPTNAARFARLARSGYFDDLTFHRVVPNFVVQGGSPGANEYSGAPAFTRDELGVPNWRGTVGLSTRGRDTGDAQLFINLVDNVRLDHDYTVFGYVVNGMDVVDSLQEGAVIRRVSEHPVR